MDSLGGGWVGGRGLPVGTPGLSWARGLLSGETSCARAMRVLPTSQGCCEDPKVTW